jgi:hypothetical protein
MTKIYIAGYGAFGWTPELLRAEAERLDALVVDVRMFPGSQRAEWAKAALQQELAERYLHVPEFGNRNYRGRGPIQIADPERGLVLVAPLLTEQSVIVLCQCPEVADCHRRLVAALLHAATEAPVVHLDPPAPSVEPGELLMLSIKQCWAWAFFCPERYRKDIENRSWRAGLAPGSLLGIHASASVSQAEYAESAAAIRRVTGEAPPSLSELRAAGQFGALLGVVTVVGWVERSDSPWFVGPHGLVVRDPCPLRRPWPVKGQQKFFTRRVPVEIAEELGLPVVGAEVRPAVAGAEVRSTAAGPDQLRLW